MLFFSAPSITLINKTERGGREVALVSPHLKVIGRDPPATYQRIFGQNAESQIAPVGCFIGMLYMLDV